MFNKLRLWFIRKLIGNDWDNQIDKLRNELDALANTYYGIPQQKFLYEESNRVEVSRRMFNQYSWTGKVKLPK